MMWPDPGRVGRLLPCGGRGPRRVGEGRLASDGALHGPANRTILAVPVQSCNLSGMGRLIEGRWVTGSDFADEDGYFRRQAVTFREWVRAEADARYPVEADRYHLYVAYACPWAHRTLIARSLRGLESAISVSVVHPFMGEDGWHFSDEPGCVPDPLFDARFLREIYLAADPEFTGRVTVPVLFDKKTKTVVNNESRDILRMFSTVFDPLARTDVELSPPMLRDQIDAVIDANYDSVNNGVYKTGFARKQKAYEEAVGELFDALERNEGILRSQRFLTGERLTEADICLFTTLLRFDPVYHTHFKCNVKRIVDYPALWGFVRDVYQTPGVAETCNFDHIRRHYYTSHESINPSRVIARGPGLDYDSPHGRDS